MKKRIAYLLIVFLLIHTTLAGKDQQPGKDQEAGKGQQPGKGQEGGKGNEGGKGHHAGKGREGGKGQEKSTPISNKKWLTLKGAEPVVAARGGLSGVFPEGSDFSYNVAAGLSLPSSVMYCDVQFTSDGSGFCQSNINLANATTIADVFPKGQKTYNVNGKDIQGWFGLDYTFDNLIANVSLVQNIHSRPSIFDGVFRIQNPMGLSEAEVPFNIWINVEYDAFYREHKINPASYVEELLKKKAPQYISSPEIDFLKDIEKKKGKANTKLIFKFQEMDAVEPTSKEKYGSLLKNLSTIKSFASGILVPKEYIWPIDKARYLEPHTTLVPDAHKEGLEVYAYGFSNDNPLSFNYSFDPAKEYLQFIDNSEFSVDGVLSDFSITASESIACLAQNKNASRLLKTLIISHNGASGDYPGSTDLAYQKAIDDGVDVIDCSVQLSKDGVAFCLNSADLTGATTAVATFADKSTTIPEIQSTSGIFSFDLTWDEIQSLKPQLRSPYDKDLNRNPKNKDKGKFVKLSEFLELAKKRTVGILINIENVPYLAAKKGLDMIKVVTTALSDAEFDKSKQKVLIQSDDTSVLQQFKQVPTYQRVFNIKKDLGGVSANVPSEIKKYADAVTVQRNAIVLGYPDPVFLTKNFSNIIPAMHAANISVYTGFFKNEFQSFLFDYYSDPYIELATYIQANIDGVVTEFPATAVAYMSSPCADQKQNLPYTILPVNPGDLYNQTRDPGAPKIAMAPAPEPFVTTDDVVDPPLPPVANIAPPPADSKSGSNDKSSTAPAPSPNAATDTLTANKAGVLISAIVGVLCLLNVQ